MSLWIVVVAGMVGGFIVGFILSAFKPGGSFWIWLEGTREFDDWFWPFR